MDYRVEHLEHALRLAQENVERRGQRPFGAVLALGEKVISTGVNSALATGDPTNHAEIEAVRAAARATGSDRFEGHIMYASGHPCPMCLSAMYLVGIKTVVFANDNMAAAAVGLSSQWLYDELAKPPEEWSLRLVHATIEDSGHVYESWRRRAE